MNDDELADHRRSIRDVTRSLAERPQGWKRFRDEVKAQFDELAPTWQAEVTTDVGPPFRAAFEHVAAPVRRVLDLGTGTGRAARVVAEAFDEAEVVGADLSEAMIREAVTHTPSDRIRYLVADSSGTPFPDRTFDLVTALNAFVFWDETARILGPRGSVAVVYSSGPDTPIYLPSSEVRRHLAQVGDWEFQHGEAGQGTWTLARRDS